MEHYFQIASIIPLPSSCNEADVEEKYDFVASMLDLIANYSNMLDDATAGNLLNWIDEALEDIWKHKEKLPDYKRDEFNCLSISTSAAINVWLATQQKRSRSPAIRAANEAIIRYWGEVVRQTNAPTPRAQKIMEKLQYRYHW